VIAEVVRAGSHSISSSIWWETPYNSNYEIQYHPPVTLPSVDASPSHPDQIYVSVGIEEKTLLFYSRHRTDCRNFVALVTWFRVRLGPRLSDDNTQAASRAGVVTLVL
jgi:hypothetical protein